MLSIEDIFWYEMQHLSLYYFRQKDAAVNKYYLINFITPLLTLYFNNVFLVLMVFIIMISTELVLP